MNSQKLKQEIEETARKEIEAGGFEGVLELEEFSKKPCFKGEIDTRGMKTIKEKYNPEYENNNPGKTKVVMRDITRHEINHKGYKGFKGCPRNIKNHSKLIIEPIAEVLMPKGYNHNDIHYIANALEDTILHSDLKREFNLDGIFYFFEDVGNSGGYTDFYEAHTKINAFLAGSKKQKKLLSKHWKHDNKVKEVLGNFVERTGLSKLSQPHNNKQIRNKGDIADFLNNEENWANISKIYAEEFSKLMKPGYALPLFDHSGAGTKDAENKPSEEAYEKNKPLEGNEFDKEMYSPEFKRSRVQEAYEDNEKVPKWMGSFEALDILYQSLAKKLKIKVETFSKSKAMPIYHYGNRPFDEDKDNMKHVVFGFNDKGKLGLKKKKYHEDIPLEYKVNPKGFPEVRFCLSDTSSSMLEDVNGGSNVGKTNIIPWGDNSKYHYSLLAWYGLLEYLKGNHILHQSSVSIGNFGSKTRIARGLAEAKKLALNPQFSNSTKLSLDEASELFNKRGMLLFTVSDGYIDNWRDIKDKFIQGAKKHHYFHLQIGEPNDFSTDLQAAGLTVRYVRGKYDLANTVIDITDK